jgi:membrane protein insertase Oxa1/YidC/SpoIIIJ
MHKILAFIMPHIFFVVVIFSIPSAYALYLFTALYLFGIYLNYKKYQKHAAEKNKKKLDDWWDILGTEKNASVSECARVRKLLSKIYHPDGGQAPNTHHMRRINQAFDERAKLPEHIGLYSKTLRH